ncbi:MAG: undecaprenyldiphospho-muramoylpentapeptide beta-N-acetylglucosaminyltransferase [Thermodesulfobacteriota bacterium]
MTAARPARVIITGGGTGGHLFPGLAVAEALREKGAEVMFVGSTRPFEKRVLDKAGFVHKAVSVEGFKGRGVWAKMKAAVKLVLGTLKAFFIVAGFSPDLVIGVGGYASAPCVFAAFCLRKKIAVQEQNVAPGAANKVASRLAGRVYATFDASQAFFAAKKVRVYGNPVRLSLLTADSAKEEQPAPDREDKAFTVAILGGSQGAHGINLAVMDALFHLRPDAGVRFIHQTGEADEKEVRQAYRLWEGPAEVAPFFHDMDRIYGQADLLVCRSGATTLAEVTSLGKPAIFVPFPHATDNHQEKNARVLEAAGAAEVILEKDITGKILTDRILALAADPEALSRMSEKCKALGKPGAALAIAQDALEFAGFPGERTAG